MATATATATTTATAIFQPAVRLHRLEQENGGDDGGEASHARGVLAIAQVATNIPKSRPKAP